MHNIFSRFADDLFSFYCSDRTLMQQCYLTGSVIARGGVQYVSVVAFLFIAHLNALNCRCVRLCTSVEGYIIAFNEPASTILYSKQQFAISVAALLF